MAPAEQLDQLRGLNGRPADSLFLRLMIAHHRGEVAMAQELLDGGTERPELRRLALSIVTDLTAEIPILEDILANVQD